MKNLIDYECNCYYLFESKSSARSCYFESDLEIHIFKKLLRRYLSKYVEFHHLHISSEGYEILLRTRTKETVIQHYRLGREIKKKSIKEQFINEPWRIISEQMRIFLCLYAKTVNKKRGRQGVLVQKRFERRYFSGVEEVQEYVEELNRGKEVESQRKIKYRVEESWKKGISWWRFRGKKWGESVGCIDFQDHVLRKLVNRTFATHNPTFHPPP